MSLTVRKSAARFVPVVAAAALLIAGCSDNSGESVNHSSETTSVAAQSEIPAGVNAADIEFLEGMYPHHAQALDMARMVDGRTDNAELLSLAAQIEAAQGPEMAQMTELLTKWGRPDPSSSSMEGMDDSAHAGHGVVVIRAGRQTRHLVRLFTTGGEHQDVRVREGADSSADFHAVEAREHQIEHDQRGLEFAHRTYCARPVVGEAHGESFACQIVGDNLREGSLVVDDKNTPRFLTRS